MNVGTRIKNRRKEIGMSADELGSRLGKNRATIYRYENGDIENLPLDRLELIAEALNTTPEYLMGWSTSHVKKLSDQVNTIPNLFPVEMKKFPLLGEIACGEPRWAEQDAAVYVSAGSDIQADFCLRAKGDSMIGARIHDGDIVFIRKQDTVEAGEIAAVLIDNEATLKRVYFDRDAGILTLLPENPLFKTLRYTGEQLNQVRILGKAVGAQIVVG